MKHEHHVPEQCVWELTKRCNMNCVHCDSRTRVRAKDELSIDECLNVAEDLIHLGNQKTTFIGGEIFLYPGWEQIARFLSDNGVAVNIITNGFMFGDRQIEQIKEAGLVNVGISIDGMRENHNKIRGKAASFQKVIRAFARLREEYIPIAAITRLMDMNLPDLDDMHELLIEQGVNIWQLHITIPSDMTTKRSNFLLDPAHVPTITDFIRRKQGERKIAIYAGDNVGYIGARSGCRAGLTSVAIDSTGNVKGCAALNGDAFIEGNLRKETLPEIWTSEANFGFNRRFNLSQLSGRCAGCPKAEVCRGGCRSYQFTGDMTHENPYCDYQPTVVF